MGSVSQDDDDRCDEWEQDKDGRRVLPFGPSYMESLMAVEDALVKDEVLDAAVPLDGRWPEPRLLWQTGVFHLRDRTCVDLARAPKVELEWVLEHLRTPLGCGTRQQRGTRSGRRPARPAGRCARRAWRQSMRRTPGCGWRVVPGDGR